MTDEIQPQEEEETTPEVNSETALVPVDENLPALPPDEAEPADPVDEPADEPEEPLLSGMAKLHKLDITDASNGLTYKVQFETDAAYAEAFIALMGEDTYEFLWGKYAIGTGQIKACNTKSDSDSIPRTTIDLLFPESEVSKSRGIVVAVGTTRRLEVFGDAPAEQLNLDLTTKAE